MIDRPIDSFYIILYDTRGRFVNSNFNGLKYHRSVYINDRKIRLPSIIMVGPKPVEYIVDCLCLIIIV